MRAGLVLLALGACTYHDPRPVDGFKCDETHACTADQSCVDGLCRDGVDLLFFDGWERRTETGCDENALIDRDVSMAVLIDTGFDTTPPYPALCSASNGYPDAEIVDDQLGPTGEPTRMLRVRQSTGHPNGTAFTVGKVLSSAHDDLYASWWVRYAPDWQWAAADHAVFSTSESVGGLAVDFGVSGNGDGSPGRVTIHVLASDQVFDSTAAQMSVGVWHFCEMRVHSGVHGQVEARVDGEPVPFPPLNEQGIDILDVNTGPDENVGSLATDFNDGAFLDANMDPMMPWFEYYDDVRLAPGSDF